MGNELNPCPFCGNKFVKFESNSLTQIVPEHRRVFVHCSECHAKGPEVKWRAGNGGLEKSQNEAKEKWNNLFKMKELKPCPFCGTNKGSAYLDVFGDISRYSHESDGCTLDGMYFSIEDWNNRKGEQGNE